jgi:hypothetical protein
MSQIVVDEEMAKKLLEATGPVLIVNDKGAMMGQFKPFKSPISDDEFQEARKQPDTDITLSEFWDLVKRGEWK